MDAFGESGDGSLQRDEFDNISNNKQPNIPDFFAGSPSTPGFKRGEFDSLSNWAIATSSNRPVVVEYEPDSLWLWTRWGEYLSLAYCILSYS